MQTQHKHKHTTHISTFTQQLDRRYPSPALTVTGTTPHQRHGHNPSRTTPSLMRRGSDAWRGIRGDSLGDVCLDSTGRLEVRPRGESDTCGALTLLMANSSDSPAYWPSGGSTVSNASSSASMRGPCDTRKTQRQGSSGAHGAWVSVGAASPAHASSHASSAHVHCRRTRRRRRCHRRRRQSRPRHHRSRTIPSLPEYSIRPVNSQHIRKRPSRHTAHRPFPSTTPQRDHFAKNTRPTHLTAPG